MASQAPTNLPVLYHNLEPLNSQGHGKLSLRGLQKIAALGQVHAIPLTVDEFALAQRHYPIIFSVGDNPVPLALMSLHEGQNTFFDKDGELLEPGTYIPAYLRRYPFLLARLVEGSDELTLCFDQSSGAVGEFDDGQALFDADLQPTDTTKALLEFCEQFEAAGLRTSAFMTELATMGLLMDGEVSIQPEGSDAPAVYRGFQMIDEEKLRNLRGDELRKINQNGILPLLFAHLFSLSVMRDIFARHDRQGSLPMVAPIAFPANA